MKLVFLSLLALLALVPATGEAAEPRQSPLKEVAAGRSYPRIVLYSTSWCPHCRAAKEYFASREIPFVNRDVEEDNEAMELLTRKYKSTGVPLIVLGNDEVILKGFDEARFENALRGLKKK